MDNTTLNSGTGGDVIRTDDVSGVKWPCEKVAYGADGAATLVDDTHPLPGKPLSASTGDYYPVMPSPDVLNAGDLSAPLINADGMLEGRFSSLSDEGSHYYPFSGAALPSDFISSTGTGQSITVANSQAVIAAGSTANAEAYWAFLVDYMPLHCELKISISQRVANQDIYFELANGATPAADTQFARLHWQGTDDTKVRCETQSSADTNGQEGIGEDFSESSSAVLTLHHIELTPQGAMFSYATDTNIVQREEELPGLYTQLYLRVRVKNGATPPTGNTLITVSYVKVANVNLTAIGTVFMSEPNAVSVQNVVDANVLSIPTDPMGTNADVGSATGSISAKMRFLAETGLAGKTSLPAGTNNIGDVDVLTVPGDPFGTNADAASAAGGAGSMQSKLRLMTTQLNNLLAQIVLAAGDNNIGNVDVLTVPADPFGANADAASATGSISAKLRAIAATGIPVTSLPTLTLAGTGTSQIGHLEANQSTNVAQINGVTPLMGAGNTGTGSPRVTIASDQAVIPVKDQAATTGGCDPYSAISTAAVLAANIKNSAGQIYGWAITNTTAAALFVRLYDLAASPGTSDTPDIRLMIPANGGNNLSLSQGHACANGIGIRATGAVADNDATALTAGALLINVFYK